jgi:hypothetical protein
MTMNSEQSSELNVRKEAAILAVRLGINHRLDRYKQLEKLVSAEIASKNDKST